MSVNTNVQIVKEEYIAGYEEIYADVKKSKVMEVKGIPYMYQKTYHLQSDKDNITRLNDLMKNKKIEYYLWRYYDFFQTILKLDNLTANLDYEHICFCFEKLPHFETILINNIWRLGKEWSHTIICCEENYSFIRSMIIKTKANNIRVIKLETNVVFIHEINDYLLNKDFLNKFHGKYLFFSNVSSLITSNIQPSDFSNNDYYADIDNDKIQLQGFCFFNKDKIIEQLENIDTKNQEYLISSHYLDNKKKYGLEKIPWYTFFHSILQSDQINNEYLIKKVITMNDFFHLDDTFDKEEIDSKVLKYLEELLNIYY